MNLAAKRISKQITRKPKFSISDYHDCNGQKDTSNSDRWIRVRSQQDTNIWSKLEPFGLILKHSKTGQDKILIPRGHSKVYAHLRKVRQLIPINQLRQFFSKKVILYQKQPIDIAYHMIQNQTKALTYISNNSYETVIALPTTLPLMIYEPTVSNKSLTYFLQNNALHIKNTYLDIHPLQSYSKLAGYLQIPYQKNHANITQPQIRHLLNAFRRKYLVSYYLEEIPADKNIQIVKTVLKQYRNQYLKTDGQLKLHRLPRKKNPTLSEQQRALQAWKQLYCLKTNIITQSHQVSEWKVNYVMDTYAKSTNNTLLKIQQTTMAEILEGQGQRQFYATFLR